MPTPVKAETAAPPAVTQNALFRLLSPAALAFLEPHIEIRPLSAGDVLYEDGDVVTHLIFPLSGVISFMARMTNGRTIEKGTVGREGFVGIAMMLDRDRAHGPSVVQINGHAAWVPADLFDEAMEQFACVRMMLLKYGRARIEQLHELVACNSLHSAERRVVRWLLEAMDRIDGNVLELKQETLADLLALRRATVSAVCHDLLSQGIINYSRGRMEVLDRGRLEASACECYERVRQLFRYKPIHTR